MSTDAVALIGFVSLFLLMLLRVPVGMAMGLVGVSGFAYLVNGNAALKLVGQTSMRTVTDFNFAVVPMFLLMGAFATTSGMSREFAAVLAERGTWSSAQVELFDRSFALYWARGMALAGRTRTWMVIFR